MKKSHLILFVAAICLLSACYSHKKVVNAGLPYSNDILWPDGYKPAESRFFVPNEITINASPQTVWDILIDAEQWHNFYDIASGLKIENTTNAKLSPSALFTWFPAGKFTSTVKQFKPPYELAWYAEDDNMKMTVYHAWLIIPTENGCKVVTQESQNGPRTFWEKTFVPKMVLKHHQKWLEGIKKTAENK